MKINEYFVAQEFIPPVEYEQIMKLHEDLRLKAFYKLVDERLVKIATYIREKLKAPVRLNTWHISNGGFQWRGHRTKECTIGAKFSMHKRTPCGAIDFNVVGMTDNAVKEWIMENQKELYALGVRRMEDKKIATTWTHLDTKRVKGHENKIHVFMP
jgi:hypothetical protein